jgi:hypothetical protein
MGKDLLTDISAHTRTSVRLFAHTSPVIGFECEGAFFYIFVC